MIWQLLIRNIVMQVKAQDTHIIVADARIILVQHYLKVVKH